MQDYYFTLNSQSTDLFSYGATRIKKQFSWPKRACRAASPAPYCCGDRSHDIIPHTRVASAFEYPRKGFNRYPGQHTAADDHVRGGTCPECRGYHILKFSSCIDSASHHNAWGMTHQNGVFDYLGRTHSILYQVSYHCADTFSFGESVCKGISDGGIGRGYVLNLRDRQRRKETDAH